MLQRKDTFQKNKELCTCLWFIVLQWKSLRYKGRQVDLDDFRITIGMSLLFVFSRGRVVCSWAKCQPDRTH